MDKGWLKYGWQFGLVNSLALAIAFYPDSTVAQVIPDNTLGAESSVINKLNELNERIDGGATRGANLFHSFLEFNVGEGRGVYFANPAGIENILSRVTGGNASHILGKLGVLGEANLFLLNPHGIIFGRNASLDIKGSFVGSTANGIRLGEEGFFSATKPEKSRLLSVNPGVLFFNQASQQSGNIINHGSLVVGKNLTLSAGNLELEGQLFAGENLTLEALNILRIRDSITSPFVAASKGNLLLQGNQLVDIFALNHANSGLFSGGDLLLRSTNTISGDAHYWSGKSFRIEKLDGSLGGLLSIEDPIIRSLGDVEFFAYQGVSLHILSGGSVNIDTVIIDGVDTVGNSINPIATPQLATVKLSDGTEITINGNIQPTLDIRAGMRSNMLGIPLGSLGDNGTFFNEFIDIINSSTNNPNSPHRADITIKDIWINADNGLVLLTNQYHANSQLQDGNIVLAEGGFFNYGIDTSRSTGKGGDVIIDSRDSINLDQKINTVSRAGNSGDVILLAQDNIRIAKDINTSVAGFNIGNAGTVKIQTQGDLKLDGLASNILTNVGRFAQGKGGDVIINADTFTLANQAFISTSVFGEGKAGNVQITANLVELNNQVSISTSTLGKGNGGNVNIIGNNAVKLDSSSIVETSVFQGGVGDAGKIKIEGKLVEVINNSYLDASSSGLGNGGDIDIIATDKVIFSQGLFTTASSNVNSLFQPETLERNGGNITITTGSLEVSKGARLESLNLGLGNAGKITINAVNSVTFLGGFSGAFSNIGQANQGDGNSGGIEITANSVILSEGAEVNSSVFGVGNAGSILIEAADNVVLDNGRIVSELKENSVGNAGGIEIIANNLNLTNRSSLNTRTLGQGNAGDIFINTRANTFLDNSFFASQVRINAIGDGGNIEISSNQLTLDNSSVISTSLSGQGKAGNILINTDQDILLDNLSLISSGVRITGIGNGGDIQLIGKSLTLSGNSLINADTLGQGDSGKITLNFRENILLNGGSIFSTVDQESQGKSRGIEINTNSLIINNGGILATSTESAGDAGTIDIKAIKNIFLDQAGVIASDVFGTSGRGGNINISTSSLSLANESFIQSITSGQGRGGDITVSADYLSLNNISGFLTNTINQGNAGNIILDIHSAIDLNHSEITTSSNIDTINNIIPTGNSGDIQIQSPILNLLNESSILAETQGQGNAGNILLQDAKNIFLDNSIISTQVAATVSANSNTSSIPSNIILDANNLTLTNNSRISAKTEGAIDAGTVTINSDIVKLTQGSQIETLTRSNANAGDIIIDSVQQITIIDQNSGLFAQTEAQGTAGNIIINTPIFNIADGAIVSAKTSNQGDGGNITINALNSVILGNNSQLTVETSSAGKAGDINITTDTLTIGKDAQLSATATETATNTEGGGSISLNTSNLNISGKLGIFAETQGESPAGNLILQTNNNNLNLNINFTDNGFISASTTAVGESGNINISAPQTINIQGEGKIAVETSGKGNAGTIDITTQTLNLADGLEISASTTGEGNAGNINLNAKEINLSETEINAFTNSTGNAGSISLSNQGNNANQVNLSNNSRISTEIQSQGQATQLSNIEIKTNDLTLNNSTITASTEGKGDAGSITVPNAQQITLNQAEITASTSGEGDTGTINLNANQKIDLNNSQINSTVQEGAIGNSQEITLNTPNLDLNSSNISAATAGKGNAGSILVPNATNITLDNSIISTAIAPTGIATQPSNITLNTQQLTLNNNSQLNASTSGEGNAGDISVNAKTITLDNHSAITTTAEATATGEGGNINLQTRGNSLILNNRSQISSRSQGQGNAGNISVESLGIVSLTDSDITTSSEQASGGEIEITAKEIRLNSDSDIRTNVNSGAGGGGDITLNADSILAYNDSDILAFALDGKGGNITLDTPVFFGAGFQANTQESNPNTFDSNNRVDINASGAVSGIITIPDLSFIRNSLTELPENLVNTDQLIANSCVVPNRKQAGTFIITGSGGLPVRPNDASISSYAIETVQPLPTTNTSTARPWQIGDPIIEPQRVYQLSNGQLVLSRECTQ